MEHTSAVEGQHTTMINFEKIFNKVLNLQFLTVDEGLDIYENVPLSELIFLANELRKKHKKDTNKVTWIIDRNVNISNVCISRCLFCNFYRPKNHKEAYITTIDEYKNKIDETIRLGGKQILLQGGLHPELGLRFYTHLFKELKRLYPEIKLHALSPPEIVHLSKLEGLSYKEVLSALIDAGLDSLPGGGAEILCDRVRRIVSKNKCTATEWLDVMRTAHQLNLITTATMMFGHIETLRERIEHITLIRQVQSEKPDGSIGFIAFIPWTFQDRNTELQRIMGIKCEVTPVEYIRTIAISRIMLPNIENIQCSLITMGEKTSQICLHAGANDIGSVMIEENVVSSAGDIRLWQTDELKNIIVQAGFEPQERNQKYENI